MTPAPLNSDESISGRGNGKFQNESFTLQFPSGRRLFIQYASNMTCFTGRVVLYVPFLNVSKSEDKTSCGTPLDVISGSYAYQS